MFGALSDEKYQPGSRGGVGHLLQCIALRPAGRARDLAGNVEHIARMAQTNGDAVQPSVQAAVNLQSAAADLNTLIARFKTAPAAP
jgi:hypothetical protein